MPAEHNNVDHREQQPTADQEDLRLLRARVMMMDSRPGPRVGDYVQFKAGTLRRISHVWNDSVQTSRGGSFYLGIGGWVAFSGSLFEGTPKAALRLAEYTHPGSVWFFHHDFATAGGGVVFEVKFRVFLCDLAPTK